MDLIQESLTQILIIYNQCSPLLLPLRRSLSSLSPTLKPLLLPHLHGLAIWAQDSPAILSVALLLLFLLIAMQILNIIRRILVFWVRLMVKVAFWGGVVILGMLVWRRGVGRSVEDAMAWGEELRVVWWREYRRWEGFQNQGGQQQREQFGRVSGGDGWR